MPLVRFEVKNEYGLGDRELYKEGEQPRAILDGVSVAGLVGILRQLGDLAEFAADIFHDLHEQVMTTTARGRKMLSRIQRIESELPSLENAIQGQRNHMHFAYIAGCNWHSNVQIHQSQLLCSDLPQFMIDSYEECRDPPRLYLLDKFDSSGAGACLNRYSDPSYFKRALASSQAVKAEKIRRKKKKRESRRNRGIRHVVFTYKDGNSTQFASPSTDHISFSGENVSFSDARSKSEMAKFSDFDSRTRTNCVEQVSDASYMMPDEQQYNGFSVPTYGNDNKKASSSVLHGDPRQDISDDDSQPESWQQQSVPSISSVTWDEKTEIVKSTGANSYATGSVDRNVDLDYHPQIFETSDINHDISKVGTDNQEDIVFELAKAPLSYPFGHDFDEVPTGAYSYKDATDLEHETQRSSESQTDPELKSSYFTCGDVAHGIQSGSASQTEQELKSSIFTCGDLECRTCRVNVPGVTNSDFFDAQFLMASCSSLNKFVPSDGFHFDHAHSESTRCHTPNSSFYVGSGYSESDVPSVQGITIPDNSMDKTRSLEPEIERDFKCQTKQELEFSTFNFEDLEPRTRSSNETSATNSQPLVVSCNTLNSFVPSDGLDHVQLANNSCLTPTSNSSIETGYSCSHIPCEPGTNVSELLDGDQSSELNSAHEQDVLVINETLDEASRSQDCVTDTSNPSPVCFWTNGGILGVEPSKPPDFSFNANPKAVDLCNESKSRNMCSVRERDQSDGDLRVTESYKNSSQGISIPDSGKYQEAESDVTTSESDLTSICNNTSCSSGSDKSLKGISTNFSGIAQKFLSNSMQRRIIVAQAGLSTSSQLVNADFRKLQEILRQNDNQELPKRLPNALCEPAMEETIKVESSAPVSSSSPHFESSSPPLEHMKISFHPMNCLETSKLKLDFSGGNIHEGSEDLVFPSFQLIPGPSTTTQDSTSESDDDTFCRSSVYSFDDLHSLNSESNSELWGEDERSESQKQRVFDNLSKASLLTTSICCSTKFGQKDRCSTASESGHLEVDRSKIYDSISDPPLGNSVMCDRNQQEETCGPLPLNSIYSNFQSPNEVTPRPPLPQLQWRILKQSDTDHSVEDKNFSCVKVDDHLDAQSQGISVHKQQEQEEPRAQCNAEAGTHPSLNVDQQLPAENRGPHHNYNIKKENGREELLYQIRSKSFNLSRATPTKQSHESVLPSTRTRKST